METGRRGGSAGLLALALVWLEVKLGEIQYEDLAEGHILLTDCTPHYLPTRIQLMIGHNDS